MYQKAHCCSVSDEQGDFSLTARIVLENQE